MTAASDFNKVFQAMVAAITQPGQIFEPKEEIIDGVSYLVHANAPDTLLELYHAALEHGDRDFMVYHDERWSYLETLEKARQLAWGLYQDFDIHIGDRVAVACRNYPEWCVTYLAVTAMGAVIVPLNSWWKADELAFAIKDCEPKLVVLDQLRADYLSPYMTASNLPGIVIRPKGDEAAHPRWDNVLNNRPTDGWPSHGIHPDDTATIFYTSGSSGTPKGVVSSARAVTTCLMTWAMLGLANKLADGRRADDKDTHLGTLGCLPLFHITGCNSMFLLSFLQGRKIVFVDKWDVTQALELIEKEKLTHFVGVPTMTYELLNAPNRSDHDLSSLEDIGAGGAARPAEQVKELKDAFNTNISLGYGMTETNALGAIIGRENYQERPASVGQSSAPFVAFKIVNADGTLCEANAVGEICIKAASNMKQYLNNAEATAETLRDGWVHTGDLGYLDDEGFLFIVDRKKNLIISGGENISPQEVENAFLGVGGVQEACAFSVPDHRLGEVVGISLYVTDLTLSEQDICSAVKPLIAHFKMPQYIWLCDTALPLIGSQKIDRASIRKTCLATLEENR